MPDTRIAVVLHPAEPDLGAHGRNPLDALRIEEFAVIPPNRPMLRREGLIHRDRGLQPPERELPLLRLGELPPLAVNELLDEGGGVSLKSVQPAVVAPATDV